jgi:hypothetical protein
MSEKSNCCPNNTDNGVCIQTDKIYDSCRDKECIENLRVYLTEAGQQIIDRAINVKFRKAEIIWVYSDVEPVPFNNGYFTIDLKFFFKIYLDVFCGVGQPTRIEGLATFDKKVILFGSEGTAKVFSSKFKPDEADTQLWQKTNLPKAQIEAVDPIALAARIADANNCCECCCGEADVNSLPEGVCRVFDDLIVDRGEKRVYVTLGLFTITRIMRKVQLIVPVIDFCIPENECIASTDNSPCELFEKLRFPVDEFFPPERTHFDCLDASEKLKCCCD